MLETIKVSYVIKVGNLYLNKGTRPASLVQDIGDATHFKDIRWKVSYKEIDLQDIAHEVNGQIIRVTTHYKEELYKGEIR